MESKFNFKKNDINVTFYLNFQDNMLNFFIKDVLYRLMNFCKQKIVIKYLVSLIIFYTERIIILD